MRIVSTTMTHREGCPKADLKQGKRLPSFSTDSSTCVTDEDRDRLLLCPKRRRTNKLLFFPEKYSFSDSTHETLLRSPLCHPYRCKEGINVYTDAAIHTYAPNVYMHTDIHTYIRIERERQPDRETARETVRQRDAQLCSCIGPREAHPRQYTFWGDATGVERWRQ